MQNGADFSKYREICSIVCLPRPRFLHPPHPTPLFTGRDKRGYKMNNRKEGTENGASQRKKRLCKNSHQSMAQQACSATKACNSTKAQHNKHAAQQKRAAQHKYSTTSVQCNKSSAQVTLHTEVQLLVRFLLAQGKFDVFNLLTECSIRGKLALDFLTTMQDSGMVAPTQFTSDLRQRHIRKLLT